MRGLLTRLLAASALFIPSLAHAYVLISTVPPATTGFVYPSAITFTPNIVTVPLAQAGTVIATAAVTNSDGSPFAGTIAVTGDPLFTAQGMNIVLARASTAADQTALHNISVVATEPAAVPPSASVALSPAAGTIPCDIGPPVAAIPAQAQAAGFTKCAMNLDFSQPLYANVANWANVNLFPAGGMNSNLLFYPDSAGVRFFSPQIYQQVYDPQSGTTVMDFHWDPQQNGNSACAYENGQNPCQGDQVGVSTWNQQLNNSSGGHTWDVGNYFVENVTRIKQDFVESTNSGGPDDIYMYSSDPYHEADFPEFQTNKFTDLEGADSGVVGIYFHNNFPGGDGFTSTNWDNSSEAWPFIGVPNYSNLQYHKYAMLRTSDGATDTRFCGFLDDIQQGGGCGPQLTNPGDPTSVDKTFNDRSVLLMSAGSNNGAALNPIDLYVQRVTVWSCPNYKTSMCNGTGGLVATTGTATNNSGLVQTKSYYAGPAN